MTKRTFLLRRPVFYGLIFGSALLLTGCMPPPAVHTVSSASVAMDQSLMRSVASIQRVTDNLRAAHGVAWHGVYQGYPFRDGTPVPSVAKPKLPIVGPLAQRMYVQWSGPVNTLMKALALKMGWRYQDASGMGDQLDVSVTGRHDTVLHILKVVASQLPDSVTVRVTPGHLSLRDGVQPLQGAALAGTGDE